MTPRALTPWILAAALALAGPSRAEDPTPAAGVRPTVPATGADPAVRPEGVVRVHASHRVDVIAPGEKVESIIDRMRPEKVVPVAREPVAQVRAPERSMVRPPGDGPGGQAGAQPGAAGNMPSHGEATPPDRRHR